MRARSSNESLTNGYVSGLMWHINPGVSRRIILVELSRLGKAKGVDLEFKQL